MLGRPIYRQAMRARREPTRQHLQVNDRDLALELARASDTRQSSACRYRGGVIGDPGLDCQVALHLPSMWFSPGP